MLEQSKMDMVKEVLQDFYSEMEKRCGFYITELFNPGTGSPWEIDFQDVESGLVVTWSDSYNHLCYVVPKEIMDENWKEWCIEEGEKYRAKKEEEERIIKEEKEEKTKKARYAAYLKYKEEFGDL